MRKLVNVACGDDYTDAATLTNVIDSSGGYFNITGSDCYVEIQYGVHGQTNFTDEVHVPIGGGILVKGTTGIRFRNFVAGSIATVSAALSEKSEPPIQIAATGQSALPTSTVVPSLTLPVAPSDGQTAILTDSLTVPTYAWEFVWSATASKWFYIGGSEKVVTINTQETTASAVYTDLATVGPAFTVPRAGQYNAKGGCNMVNNTASQDVYVGCKFGAAAVLDIARNANIPSGSQPFTTGWGSPIGALPTVNLADVIKLQYRIGGAGTGTFLNRSISITPIYVT